MSTLRRLKDGVPVRPLPEETACRLRRSRRVLCHTPETISPECAILQKRNGQKKRRTRLHSEKPACPRRGNATAVKAMLRCRQPERGGKGCWNAEQPDRDLPTSFWTCIAREALLPREARVRALRTGEDHLRDGGRSGGR